jgi:adenylate cyclase
MGLLTTLDANVSSFITGTYETFSPQDVPLPEDLTLKAGKAADFEAAMLFIDVRESSTITDAFRLQTAAKMIRAYADGAVRIVHANSGRVRSFNGDGMLAVFIGANRCDNSVNAAMQCKWFVNQVLRRKFGKFFANNAQARKLALDFKIGCGIDVGRVYAVRIGIGGTNDIAWVGRPTNTAAKLSDRAREPRNIVITGEVWSKLSLSLRIPKGVPVWSPPSAQLVAGARRLTRTTSFHKPIA